MKKKILIFTLLLITIITSVERITLNNDDPNPEEAKVIIRTFNVES